MLWHFRANLQQGPENSATRLWQWELENVETAQAHMGKLSKNIVPSSIFIACTVKTLRPLLLTKLFLWDCNHSSSQLKNHQVVRRTLEGQTEWLTSGSVHRVQRNSGPGCWDVAVSSGDESPSLRSCPSTVPEGLQQCLCLAMRLLDEVLAPPWPAPPLRLAQHGWPWPLAPGRPPRLAWCLARHSTGAAVSLHPESDSLTY